MNLLPPGSDRILNVLMNLDPKLDNTAVNRKTRLLASQGMIYAPNNFLFESICPFCQLKKRKQFVFQPRSSYSHTDSCPDCIEFKKIIAKMNDTLLSKIAELCSISNISIRTLYSPKFNEILQTSNPFYRTIKRSEIRKKIFELFENIRNELHTKNSEEFCSILIDGAKRNNKNFYCWLIHTKKRLFYFTIQKVKSATSEIITQLTIEVIDFLRSQTNLELVSICSDHASNLTKAFNACDQKSCQNLSNYFFQWVGCFAHLINLGIGDLFESEEFCNIYISLSDILQIIKQLDLSKKVPSFSKTRWESYSKSLNFLNSNKNEIINYFNEELKKLNNAQEATEAITEKIEKFSIYIEILDSDLFNELTQLFEYISEMSSKIGSDCFLICYVYPEIIKFNDFISNLDFVETRGFGNIIFERITSSDEYIIAITAYFLTLEGRDHFLKEGNENKKKKNLECIFQYLFYYNEKKFGKEKEILENQINLYLSYKEFPFSDSFELWENWRSNPQIDLLANIAIRILHMACTEIPVERLFSHLKYLYGSKNFNKSEDLLNAQLSIRMEEIYEK